MDAATAPTGRRPAAAFTLIELLVVISIIALLLALLLPTLRQAKEAALVSRCLSNQRQVGIALFSYAADYGGMIPQPSWNVVGSGNQFWHRMITGNYDAPSYFPETSQNQGFHEVMHCPKNGTFTKGQPYSRPGVYAMANVAPRFGVPAEPAYHARPVPSPAPAGFVAFKGLNLDALRHGSTFLMVGDSTIERRNSVTFPFDVGGWVFRSFNGTNTGGTYEAGLFAIHQDRLNGLYGDGHAATHDDEALLATSNINGNPGRPTGISWWVRYDLTVSGY